MDKVQEIKNESLHDGKGVIVHIDNFNWLIEHVEKYEKALGDINEYIPTRDFQKDVHNLKTIADNSLK